MKVHIIQPVWQQREYICAQSQEAFVWLTVVYWKYVSSGEALNAILTSFFVLMRTPWWEIDVK